MSDPLRPALGLVAGKYEVLQLIGRGGMGSVWEGRHSSLGTRVAIKFVDAEHADSEEARARFVTEARAAATIRSKHAIQIYDHGLTDEGRPYIVMELLVGEPLDRRIDRLGRISLDETARIVAQVCRALQRAHDVGIIHRDLKPENIFIVRSSDDEDEVAKVLDFGIAKIKPPPGEQPLSSSTKTGAVLGTPYYMSPEQARGLRNIDHRTDLWSLGVIAYKCVTGALPFQGESVGDLLVKICTGAVPVPSNAVPGLPASFDAWFARALDRDPERRFARALELSEALSLSAGTMPRRGAPSGETEIAAPAFVFPRGGEPSGVAAGGLTSAPLTSATGGAKSGRSTMLAVVAAALLGGSVGVVAVAKLAGSSAALPAAIGADAQASRPNTSNDRSNGEIEASSRVAPSDAGPVADAETTRPAAGTPMATRGGRAATPDAARWLAPVASHGSAPSLSASASERSVLPKVAPIGEGKEQKAVPAAADPGY